MKALKKILHRKVRAGSSGAEVLLFGMMMIILLLVFVFINTVRSGYSAKFSMIDGNLTSSLLSVAYADMKTNSETGVITLANTTNSGITHSSPVAQLTRVSSCPDSALITNLFDALKINFNDSDNSDDSQMILTNDTIFGEGGQAKLIAVTVVNKEVFQEETFPGIIATAYKKYNLRSTQYVIDNVDSVLRYDYDYKTGGVYAGATDWAQVRATNSATEIKITTDNILKTDLRLYEDGLHKDAASLKVAGKTKTGEDIEDCTISATLKIDFGPGFGNEAIKKFSTHDGNGNKTGDAEVDTSVDGIYRTRTVQVKLNSGT